MESNNEIIISKNEAILYENDLVILKTENIEIGEAALILSSQ